jgi:DNA-binding transcriptional ArsR family regulator
MTRGPAAKDPRETAARTTAGRRRTTTQLRALAHPLRLRLLEAFAQGRRTTMQVAAQLGEPPTRLYHHVNALERAGVLKLVDTRQVRGTTEKYFELASHQIGAVYGERVTDETRASLGALASAVFDEARGELLAAMSDPKFLKKDTAPIALRMLISLPPSSLPRFRRRILTMIQELKREYRRKGSKGGAGVQCALTVAMAPTLMNKK